MASTLAATPLTMDVDKAPEQQQPAEDLYTKYKMLQQKLAFLEVQEDYIKDEMKVRLKRRTGRPPLRAAD